MTPAGPPEKYFRLVEHDGEVLALLTRAARAHQPSLDVSDWQVTLLFYLLCIYIKALARTYGKDIQDHYDLKQWINTEPAVTKIARPYRHIEEASRDARYEGRLFSVEFITARLLPRFAEVRDHVVGLLKSRGHVSVSRVDAASLLAGP